MGRPRLTDSKEIFGLVHDDLPPSVLVAASMNITWAGGYEDVYVASALVRPDRAEDLQRALAAATEPWDWRLPDEDETEHEVDHGLFELRGWLRDPDPRTSTSTTPTLRGCAPKALCPDTPSGGRPTHTRTRTASGSSQPTRPSSPSGRSGRTATLTTAAQAGQPTDHAST
ncbi:hypothetical protein ACFPH6_36275 [Streptomyces xiangluensis]|uniref:Phospholipase D-like domain-containing protein n=1 Tax=Streptomyces xiangluensis TaxID=2665720 RepID=A0ABV8YXL4_9ACTN